MFTPNILVCYGLMEKKFYQFLVSSISLKILWAVKMMLLVGFAAPQNGAPEPDAARPACAGAGPQTRSQSDAEPGDHRAVLRHLLAAAVHHQLRAGLLSSVRRAQQRHQWLHHLVSPQLGRQPALICIPSQGGFQRFPHSHSFVIKPYQHSKCVRLGRDYQTKNTG